MKKWTICLLAGMLLFMPLGAWAANISLQETLFLSSVRWYDGTVEQGQRISALKTGETYETITALVEVAKNTGTAAASQATLTGEIVNAEGQVTYRTFQTKTLEERTEFELVFTGVAPQTGQDKLRILVWDGMQRMQPLTGVQELQSESDPVSQTERDMQTIRERIIQNENLYSTSANPQSLLDRLDENGRFNNVDYTQTGEPWGISNALVNVTTMLQAYYSEGNAWYQNSELFEKCELVLRDWAEHQYKSTNWWHQQINVPQKLSTILLYPLPEDADYLPALRELAKLGLPVVDESTPHKSDRNGTGGNLTDKLQTAIKIAAATDDAESMEHVVQYLLDNELSVFSHLNDGEGIMVDGSFHQHGALLYNGSYGSVFCTGVNKLLRYLADTEFMVSDRAVNAYADFILDGHSLMFRGNGSDFAMFGRAISRPGGVGGSVRSNSLDAVNVLLTLPGVERRTELLALKNQRLSGTDYGLNTAKHFWTSDFTVVHRDDFYVSVRNSSNRNKNTEYMNNENSKAYYIADGATVIMQSGTEYYDIFPVWDWSKIPGTTTAYLPFASIPSPAAEKGQKEFVGGVTNGLYAVSAMDYAHNGVSAKKANFFFDDGFMALGAGITGTQGNTVYTTLNQCLLSGDVRYSSGGSAQTLPGAQERSVPGVSWVLHGGVGYYFPQSQDVLVGNAEKSGTWQSINSSKSGATVTKDVFCLSMSHGAQPQNQTYAYTVLPAITEQELTDYAQNPDMVEIANSAKSTAVWSKQANSVGIVFWSQGISNYKESVTVPASVTGMEQDLTITAEEDPCIVLLTKQGNTWELCVSNPKNDSLAQTTISINRPLTGDGAVYENGKTTVTVPFPQDLERGKSVAITLTEAGQ